jgi:uncharacterized membrane-anchored protein
MRIMDGILAWNARQAQRLSVISIVLKAFVGFLLAGIVMAVIVPPMHARGVPLRAWMVWTVMALSIAICIGPDLYRRYRRRPV